MHKLDLVKTNKSYFTAQTTPTLVDIGPARFAAIRGKGDPSGQPFADAIEALYTVAYTLKFNYKAKEQDFVVSKLEGLWWFDEEKFSHQTIVNSSVEVPRSEWEYRLLIRLPEFVTADELEMAKQAAIAKGKSRLAAQVEYFTMHEGKAVQMLHVGPFSTEPESLQQIGEFITANQLSRNGLHHEIYLSDFRKTEPHKLRTILREPVK